MSDERSRRAAGSKSLLFWVFLFAISSFLILSSLSVAIVVIWVCITLAIALGGAFWKINLFSKRENDLLSMGKSLTAYDYSQQTRRLFLIVGLTILAFLAPLLLAGILGFGFWFTSIIGAIDGWILHLVLYNLFLLRWESNHGGRIFSIQIWSGTKVTYTGLEFERSVAPR